MQPQRILVTGSAGFIGFHRTRRLATDFPGARLIGLDNVNAYYDPQLKEDRLSLLSDLGNFSFHRLDLANREGMESLFQAEKPDLVIHLAAQAGVRYSIQNPHAYVDSNLTGFMNILEGCRHNGTRHLLFASSSSVYGANTKVPFSVHDNVDHPISLYAATKKANELMAHTYAHLYRLPCTGLRFFTVYGPWGRPDMALFKFTRSIYDGKAIEVYNNGDMKRDFTYVDDIVEGVSRLSRIVPEADSGWNPLTPDPASSNAPYRIYNIGNNQPEDLMTMIRFLEEETGVEAVKTFLPMQAGDVYATFADTDDLARVTGFKPYTPLKTGIRRFVSWYRDYYKLGNGPA